mmetsp:Transcript_25427/g.41840  ORF Transcript_25427/g.41840 Transcript_25427/m.41840 type:complete len:268 (+) Transcript_25427:459-1262(+)
MTVEYEQLLAHANDLRKDVAHHKEQEEGAGHELMALREKHDKALQHIAEGHQREIQSLITRMSVSGQGKSERQVPKAPADLDSSADDSSEHAFSWMPGYSAPVPAPAPPPPPPQPLDPPAPKEREADALRSAAVSREMESLHQDRERLRQEVREGRAEEASLQSTIRKLTIELSHAVKPPSLVQYQQLEMKVEKMELAAAHREQDLRRLLDKAHNDADSKITNLNESHRKQLAQKNSDIERFRKELDDMMRAMQRWNIGRPIGNLPS